MLLPLPSGFRLLPSACLTMSDFARIDSIDVIREFRAALWKFAEVGNIALGDAESDIQRTMNWLEFEQTSYWEGQIRRRREAVSQAAEKVREKRLFLDATGRPQSAIDEERLLKLARQRLAEAEEKLQTVRKYVRALQKLQQDYKGAVQGFATAVAHDIPLAVARLDELFTLLQRYTELQADPAGAEPATGPSSVGMARAEDIDRPPIDELPDFPEFAAPQVVLVHTHRPSGLTLATDGKTPAEDGSQYRRFASQEEAELYARQKIEADPQISCAIYASDRSKVAEIRDEPKI